MKRAPDPTGCYKQTEVKLKTCYKFGYVDLEKKLPAMTKFVVPYNATEKIPSSLGQADLDANWRIELTEFGPGTPVPGTDVSTSGAAKYTNKELTLTIIGEVRPRPADPLLIDDRYATASSFNLARAYLSLQNVSDN
jgi:hypothetical protein